MDRTRPTSFKQYKKKFLAAEALQRASWGLIDAWRQGGRLRLRYGFLDVPERDFSYHDSRGWKK
jgi:hypothetical protein